jgi:2-aminoadipate transaminase
MPSYRFATRAQAKATAPVALPEGTINLSGGFAFPQCLPNVAAAAAVAAEEYRTEAMQYSGAVGLNDLRDAIVNYVAKDGVTCTRDNVIVVNGAKHGLDLVARVFLEPGDAVIVTGPTYMTALSILRTHEARFLSIPQDEEGLDAVVLEEKLEQLQRDGAPMPKLLFDVPDFHNPSGITMSARRRRALVDLAKRYGFVIIEDDPYRRIRFDGEAVAPIKSFDDAGVVIAVGTAAKVLAPGLRIGWIIADPEIVRQLAAQKADGGTSAFTQRIFVELLRTGEVAHHIDLITNALREHCDAMIKAFAKYMPDVKVRRPQGGYYLWAELPEGVDSDMLAGLGASHGVLVYSGTKCFAADLKRNFLRLCYSFVTPEQNAEGIRRLSEAYAEMQGGLNPAAQQRASHAASSMATY